MGYLLDTNVFIQARNLHYGFDICPGFWDWLDIAHTAGRVLSIEQVKDELVDPDLAVWAGARPAFFLQPDAAVVSRLGDLSTWATTDGYEPGAIGIFLAAADYFLVATALAHQHTVVTHEVASDTRKKVKIPNACIGMGVKFMNPFTMLRAEGARFVLP